MKNLCKLLGIVAIGAVIAISGCDNGSTDDGGGGSSVPEALFGTWVRISDSKELTFESAGSYGVSYSSGYGGGLLEAIDGSSFTCGGGAGTYTYTIANGQLTVEGAADLAGTYNKEQ
jgi:hypothetical protein